MHEAPLYALAGLIVGIVIGLTGVGGGSLMTPVLVLFFGQSTTVAVGTDLVFSASTKLAATASFGQSHRVDWVIVRRLALGSVPGTLVVIAWYLLHRGRTFASEHAMTQALGVLLAIAAAGLLLQYPLRRAAWRLSAISTRGDGRYMLALTCAAGLLVGVAITLTSVGAGALGIVALLILYPLRLSGDRLVATDIAHALPVTALAGVTHAVLGHVDPQILASLLAGSVPGVWMASRITLRLPGALVNALIAMMLLYVSQRLLWRG
jgi:uncharacterized protein